MWYEIDSDLDLEVYHERAKKQLEEATYNLIVAEASLREIESRRATEILRSKHVFRSGIKVIVDFKDAPNTIRIFEGVRNGVILLRRVSKRGYPLKTVESYDWSLAKFIKPAA